VAVSAAIAAVAIAPRGRRAVAAAVGAAYAAAVGLAVLVLGDAVAQGPLTDAEIARTRTAGVEAEGAATAAAIGVYACLTRPVTRGA
jgi:hypothetical protein